MFTSHWNRQQSALIIKVIKVGRRKRETRMKHVISERGRKFFPDTHFLTLHSQIT